ncbi:hypothetical protein [Streptomyces ureilyticus]|nr:hypothetical protein [Streptomyces ureilyticus]
MREESFGSSDISVGEITAHHADHVRITDLCSMLPPTVAAAWVR